VSRCAFLGGELRNCSIPRRDPEGAEVMSVGGPIAARCVAENFAA